MIFCRNLIYDVLCDDKTHEFLRWDHKRTQRLVDIVEKYYSKFDDPNLQQEFCLGFPCPGDIYNIKWPDFDGPTATEEFEEKMLTLKNFIETCFEIEDEYWQIHKIKASYDEEHIKRIYKKELQLAGLYGDFQFLLQGYVN